MKIINKERGTVICGDDSWLFLENHLHKIQPSNIFIFTDTNVEKACLPYFLEKISNVYTNEIIVMPVGEEHKNIATCANIWKELSEKGADRKSLMINLGGGVVTDLGGFIASTYRRGIEFINIPTSLLAMVDASIGGKNGIDLGHLKNQIGLIRNPLLVIIDIEFLKTLPKAEVTSGYAEMLKHGLIRSENYWNELKNFDIKNTAETSQLIWRSVEIKNDIVTKDPNENGLRKMLNYGHTLGHAIESYFLSNTVKKNLLHGEAIAIGMILSTYVSSETLNFPKQKLAEITNYILKHFPKVAFEVIDIEKIIELLIYDKKNSNGKIFFVLLKEFGDHEINREVSNELIYNAFDYYENFKKKMYN